MAADEKWYFTKEQLANTPSRRAGIDADKELSYRQQAANFIQDMGQRLYVTQLCINTAIVYMHRFYLFHSLTQFHRNAIAVAALFLAAKVEEQPRKLEHVIKVSHMCLHRDTQAPETKSDQYLEQAQDLVFNENVLLQTLGFEVAIDHPHTHVVKCCQLVKASKELAQTSYFMASNSLHLTTMCLQYKPTVVACFCIHLACKWSSWEIPKSNEGKHWFWYVDKTVTSELLQQLTVDFLQIFDKCPSRLKRKIMSISANQSPNMNHPSLAASPFENEPRKIHSPANAENSLLTNNRSHDKQEERKSAAGKQSVDYKDYRDKKEKLGINILGPPPSDLNKHNMHHHKQTPGMHTSMKHGSSSTSSMKTSLHHHHHRQDQKINSSQTMVQKHSSGNLITNRDSSKQKSAAYPQQYQSTHHSYLTKELDYVDNFQVDSNMAKLEPPTEANILTGSFDKYSSYPYSKQQSIDKRFSDPRSQKASTFSKYSDARLKRGEIIDIRAEDVKKGPSNEKSLPPPKIRPETMKEDHAIAILKQYSKYNHSEKPSNSALGSDLKLNVGQTAFLLDKSPNAPIAASQSGQKSSMMSSKIHSSAHSALHLPQDPVKMNTAINISSTTSLINITEDLKNSEKKQKYDEQPFTKVQKPRSLFSPEKTPFFRDHRLPNVNKSKASPIAFKTDLPDLSTFPGDQSEIQSLKNKASFDVNHSLTLNSENDKLGQPSLLMSAPVRQENYQNFDKQDNEEKSHKLMSDQSINSNVSNLVDINTQHRKPSIFSPKHNPISTKGPLESLRTNETELLSQKRTSTNDSDKQYSMPSSFISSYNSNYNIKPELTLPDEIFAKQEHEMDLTGVDNTSQEKYSSDTTKNNRFSPNETGSRRDSYSPLKSAQSIKALLQETPAPMPSLLQNVTINQQYSASDVGAAMTPNKVLKDAISDQKVIQNPSAEIKQFSTLNVPTTSTFVETGFSQPNDGKHKLEHRNRTEKKKKKDKHKHKEKDKSKDKHKHKHKEKEKSRDKGPEKDKVEDSIAPVTAPIKITIPKDKLTDVSGLTHKTKSHGIGLKIKIPKERLKGTEVPEAIAPEIQPINESPQLILHNQNTMVQAPLKIKIRADTIKKSDHDVRKRERSIDASDVLSGPPLKKQQQFQQPPPPHVAQPTLLNQQPHFQNQQFMQQQQRHNGRQHGSVISRGSTTSHNNKDKLHEAVAMKPDARDITDSQGSCLPANYSSSQKYLF